MERCFKERTENSKDHWETPNRIFKLIEKTLHLRFTLDPASSHTNHKCEKYYTKKEDGLKQSWKGEKVFCNPPYKNKDLWIKKGFEEGEHRKTIVVLLIPVNSDTKIWHQYVMKAQQILFVKGRISFELDGVPQGSPTFASCIVVFNSVSKKPKICSFYHKEKDLIKQFCKIEKFL